MLNIDIIYEHHVNRYIITGIYPHANKLTLELLCKALVNEENNESYDCHNPDLVLNNYLL